MADDTGKALGKAVEEGVKGVAVGTAVAGTVAATAAAIGGSVGAAFGPFAPIAAPLGAALGALIGFFVGLVKATPSKEELRKQREAAEAARIEAHNKGWVLAYAAETLLTEVKLDLVGADNPVKALERTLSKPNGAAQALRDIVKKNPAFKPMIDNLFAGLRWAAAHPDLRDRAHAIKQLQSTIDLFKAIGSQPGDLPPDPFLLLRPPLRDTFAPAFAAAGINIDDPAVVAQLQVNYDVGRALAARPRPKLGSLPIRRRSVGLRSGGRVAVDTRAFSPVAPYGVGSFRIFPAAAPPGEQWRRGDDNSGEPLQGPWPYGLDADRFALPPPRRAAQGVRQGMSAPSPIVPLSLGALLLLLL